jgi:hypothetical protein
MSRTATNQSVVEESMFLRWLANHAGNGLVKIGRAGDTLALKVNMVVARRFAIGDIDSAPFLGIQQPELVAFNEIEWTHIELCPNITPATLTLSSEGLGEGDRPSSDQLPVRIIIPAKVKSIKQFGLINKQFLDLRRIVVNEEGRVDRVARLAVKRLPLKIVRATVEKSGGKTALPPGKKRRPIKGGSRSSA